MAVEPIWLTRDDVDTIHAMQLQDHGGVAGYNDAGLVASAVVAPCNLYLYERQDDVLALAIRLCFAIVRNHPFTDGNKRTATASMIEFLAVNGFDLVIDDDEPDAPLLGQWIDQLVTGNVSEAQLRDILEPFVFSASSP